MPVRAASKALSNALYRASSLARRLTIKPQASSLATRANTSLFRGSLSSQVASRHFSTQNKPEPEASPEETVGQVADDEREPWMYIDERIKPRSRSMKILLEEEWPDNDEDERKFVGEFMRGGRDFIREQERLKSIKPELHGKIRGPGAMKKHGSRRIREEGSLPCIIFGRTKNHNYKPLPIEVSLREIIKQMRHNGMSFFATIFRMHIEGRKEGILVKPQQLQYHPVTRKFESMTFVRWSPGKKTRVVIPVEIVGERDCIGVKNGGAVLTPTRGVKCVYDGPGPLPRKFQINIQNWDVGQRYFVKDLEMPPDTRLRRPEIAHTQVLVSIRK